MSSQIVNILEHLHDKVVIQGEDISDYQSLISSYRKIMFNEDIGIIRQLRDVMPDHYNIRYIMANDILYCSLIYRNNSGRVIDLYQITDTYQSDPELLIRKLYPDYSMSEMPIFAGFMLEGEYYDDESITGKLINPREVLNGLHYYRYDNELIVHVNIDTTKNGKLDVEIFTDKEDIKFEIQFQDDDLINTLMWKDNLILLCRCSSNSLVIYVADIYTQQTRRIKTSLMIEFIANSVIYDNCLYIHNRQINVIDEIMNIMVIKLETFEQTSFAMINQPAQEYIDWYCTTTGTLYMETSHSIYCVKLPTWSMIKKRSSTTIPSKKIRVKFTDNVMRIPENILSKFEYFSTHIRFNSKTSQQSLKVNCDTNLFKKMINFINDGAIPSMDSIIQLIQLCDFLINDDIKNRLYLELYLLGYHPCCMNDAINIMESYDIDDTIRSIFLNLFILHRTNISIDQIRILCDANIEMLQDILKSTKMNFSLFDYNVLVAKTKNNHALVKI